MKCPNCGYENKLSTRYCKKCSADLSKPPIWFCDTKWHLKTLLIIYISLTALYFIVGHILRKLPPPYDQRIIPAEMTPWLNPKKKIEN
ncbi:MAG: zinc-ribbon domain-containing protein [Elusimicrobiales bacterium]